MKLKTYIANNATMIFTILFVFAFYFFLCYAVPLVGDDWGNYLNGSSGLGPIIDYAVWTFQNMEGRFFSRIILTYLSYHRWLWVLLNASLLTFLFYSIMKIVNPNKKFLSAMIIFLCMLLIDGEGLRQGYFWIAGNVTYLFPIGFVFFILYMHRHLTEQEIQYHKVMYILFPILTIFFTMFVETVGVAIIICFFAITLYDYIHYKRLNYLMLTCTIIAIITFGFVAFGPGTMARLDTEDDFNQLSLLNKIVINVPQFISYTFIRNWSMIIILSFDAALIIFREFKNVIVKVTAILFMVCIPFFSATVGYLDYLGYDMQKFIFILDSTQLLIILYWIVYGFVLIYLALYYTKRKELVLLLIIIAICCNASMFLSPIWGGRTALMTSFAGFTAGCIILEDLNIPFLKNNAACILLFIPFLYCTQFYLKSYYYVYQDKRTREGIIQTQLQEDRDSINVYILSERFLWNPNPWNEGYLRDTFKSYYQIPKEKEIIMGMGDE